MQVGFSGAGALVSYSGWAGPEAEQVQEDWEWDAANFEQVVLRYQSRIHRFIYCMTGETELAQDLTQETFLRAYRDLTRCSQRERSEKRTLTSNFSAWLYTIARNTTLSEFRRRKPKTLPFLSRFSTKETDLLADEEAIKLLPGGFSPEDGLSLEWQVGLRDELQQAMERVGRRKLTALLLYVHGFSYREICAITGDRMANVKTKIFRAKEALRQALTTEID